MDGKVEQAFETITFCLDGGASERLRDLLEEPDAWDGAGHVARVGAAFTEIGKSLTDAAKQMAEQQIEGGVGQSARMTDGGVLFEWSPPREYVRVDAKQVKQLFPQDEYPELYGKGRSRAYTKVTIGDAT